MISIKIKITKIVHQLRIGSSQLQVKEDDFFEENIVRNLAALLGIPMNKVRVVEIISAGGKRRRRRS